MKLRPFFIVVGWAIMCSSVSAQQLDRKALLDSMEKDGCVALQKVRMCNFDYPFDDANVEAITFRTEAEGKYPGMLLVPGYQRSAPDSLSPRAPVGS